MKRKNNRKNLVFEIIFYIFILLIGLYLVETSSIIKINKLILTECVLNIIGFVSIILYVINRVEKDTEYIEFGFINILTATFISINEGYLESFVVLGNSFLIYSTMYIVSKLYNSYKLYKNKKINYISKLSIGITLGLFGIKIALMIFKKYLFADYILGYYFILFGLLSLLEPLIDFLLRNPNFQSKIRKILKYKNEDSKKKIIIRKIPTKKINKIKK